MATPERAINVLVIEDNPDDRELFRRQLRQMQDGAFSFREAETLDDGLSQIGANSVDLVALDLNLPDSSGLETLQTVFEAAPSVPIIVLTGETDNGLGVEAIKQGAQDFIIKGEFSTELVTRCVRYTLERQRLAMALEAAEFREQQEREQGSIERLADPPKTGVSARAFNVKRLRDAAPMQFSDIAIEYRKILTDAVEQKATVADFDVPARLKQLAARLARMRIAPRDLVELHLTALQSISSDVNPKKARVASFEGRLVLLETMGHLAGEYRLYALGRADED